VATLFASLLGYNPIQQLLGSSANALPAANRDYLTGRDFFPHLISGPFHDGLQVAFIFAIIACLIAAYASWLRGGKYHAADADLGMTSAPHDHLPFAAGDGAVAPPELLLDEGSDTDTSTGADPGRASPAADARTG
jgi:hypothetical protein